MIPRSCSLLALLALVASTPDADASPARWRADALRIKLMTPVANESDAAASAAAIATAQGTELLQARRAFLSDPRHAERKQRFGLDCWIRIDVPHCDDLFASIEAWQAHGDVEVAEGIPMPIPIVVPSDPLFPQQWEHDNTGTNPGVPPGQPDADLDTVEAWDLVTGDVLVANLESVDWFHEDLVGRLWQNPGEDLDGDGVLEWDSLLARHVLDPDDLNASDDDGNGLADDLIGWNFAEDDPFPETGSSGHGTATAGFLVAEPENDAGIAGTCHDCRLLAIRGDVATGLVYAADQGAGVVSVSLVEPNTQAFRDALDYASSLGVVVVAGAGNLSTTDANPICANPGVLCVGATNPSDQIVTLETTGGVWGTNYGPLVDVGAPGAHLTYLLAEAGYGVGGSGTSFSAPLVAGVAALVQTANPMLTPPEVLSILQSTTDPYLAPDRFAGQGRVNAKKAVDAALAAGVAGSYPVALLAPVPAIDLYGNMEIFGNAFGPDFVRYRIRLGVGLTPAVWIADEEIFTPVSDGVLYSLNVASFPRMTDFHVELTVFDTNGQSAIDVMHPVLKVNSFSESPDWPVSSSEGFAAPTFGDLDGDETLELLVRSEGHYAYDVNGNVLPGWPINGIVSQWNPPALLDLDDDGDVEMLTPYEESPGVHRLFAYEHDASFAPGWPQTLAANAYQYPVVGDLDGDGVPEIVQCAWAPQPFPTIHVFRRDGTSLPGWPLTLGHDLNRAPMLADVDGDGDMELVLRATGNVHVLDVSGSEPSGWPLGNFASRELVSADLDGDSVDEIVRARLGEIFVHRGDGSIRPGWPQLLSANIGALAIGDVDGDESPEIFAATVDERFYLFEQDGSPLAPWPLFFSPIAVFRALANVDSDPALEVIFSAGGEIHAVDGDGTPLEDWPVIVDHPAEEVTLADFDADGDLELLIVVDELSGPGTLGTIHLFDLAESSPADDWVLEHRDATNSRRYVSTPSATPVPPTPVELSGFSLSPPRPNPSSSQVHLSWAIPLASHVRLQVFDVSGRLVRTLLDTELEPGEHSTVWTGIDRRGRPVGSGVYFVRLDAPPHSAVRRFVGIRP